MNPKGS
jgi:hypothetical protein